MWCYSGEKCRPVWRSSASEKLWDGAIKLSRFATLKRVIWTVFSCIRKHNDSSFFANAMIRYWITKGSSPKLPSTSMMLSERRTFRNVQGRYLCVRLERKKTHSSIISFNLTVAGEDLIFISLIRSSSLQRRVALLGRSTSWFSTNPAWPIGEKPDARNVPLQSGAQDSAQRIHNKNATPVRLPYLRKPALKDEFLNLQSRKRSDDFVEGKLERINGLNNRRAKIDAIFFFLFVCVYTRPLEEEEETKDRGFPFLIL